MDSNPLAKVKAEGQIERFESSNYGFESLLAQNSNLAQAIRIPYTAIRISESGVMKNKARRFESSSYGFESLSKNEG